MLERLTPLFTHLSRALREESLSEPTHWDTLLDHPRELAENESGELNLPDNVTLIVGAPVFFPNSLDNTDLKP